MVARRNFRNIILCDAVYVDQSTHKAVIAGVYIGDILLPSIPGGVRLSLYGEYIPDTTGDIDLELSTYLDRKLQYTGKMRLSNPVVGQPTMLIAPNLQLNIDTPSILSIRASVDGARPIELLKKRLDVRTDTSSSVAPSC